MEILDSKHDQGQDSTSDRAGLAGGVSLFLRLWSYGGPSQPLSGFALEQDPEVAELIRGIIRDGEAVTAVQQTELLTARFDNSLHAISTAKALQQRFLTFHRKTEPQQVVPSILIAATPSEKVSGSATPAASAAPEDMLANVTSAQILVVESIYGPVKNTPGFRFNPKPVREAGPTGEAVYELLWTDESTYGHLRQVNRVGLNTQGRYEIQEELGRGAMGAVYKAYDQVIKRTVALKTISIHRNAPDRDDLIERLKQEARAAGGLDHPNIITIYDVGQEDDVVYLSMQFLEGKTLLKLLAEGEVPSLPTLIAWADQILSGVGYAHARGVIHRDLKPANLMLTSQGIIKILDFGIAKVENVALTQTGLVVGTPSYMAPEQVAGKKVDQRADLFALGSVFYELVTHEKPFRGDVTTILYKIMHEEPVAPSIINPAIPGGIDAIIRKALAKDPKERFQTCEEMREAFLEQAALLDIEPPGVPTRKAAKSGPHSPVAIPSFLVEYSAQPSKRIGPILASVLALAAIGTTSWAFYIRSHTGSFPPPVQKLVAAVQRTLQPPVNIITPEESAGPHPGAKVNDQTTQNGTANDTATAATSSGAQGSGMPGDAEKAQEQTATDNSASDSAHASTAISPAPTPGQTQPPQSSGTSGQPVVAAPPVSGQPAGDGVNTANTPAASGDAGKAPATSDTAESQPAAPSFETRPFRRPRPEPALTVDGFTRSDVPELVRQADAAAGRGDYRLARYEYQLILKLDPGNATARAGLRRIHPVEQAP